jgi:hemerythrin
MNDDWESNEQLTGIATLLNQAHKHLEQLFTELLAALRAGASDEFMRTWMAFDVELNAHFDLEEKYLLPQLAQFDAAEVADLRREHNQIRQRFAQLNFAADSSGTGDRAIEEFCEAMATHAARQDALMYRWAEASLGSTTQAAIRVLLLDPETRLRGGWRERI